MLDLTKLFSHSRDLGFVTDLRGAILAATAGAERALGYDQKELVGLDLPHLDEGGDLQRFFNATPVRSRMNLGFHLRTRSGAVLTVGALVTSLRNEAGAPVGWFIAGQDLKGAVAEARGTQPILDALMDCIGAALWSFDRNGTVITWSRACEPAFGVPRSKAEGILSVVRLFPSPAEYRRVIEAVDQAGFFSGEIALQGTDGVARPNQISITPLISGGLSVGYTCVSLDISNRKQVEELQRTYFEQAGEAIAVVDMADLRLIDVNDQACHVFGRSREELLALDIPKLRSVDLVPSISEVVAKLGQKGFYESDRESFLRKDGSRFPCAVNVRLISVGGKLLSVGVIRDLTEQRKAEEFQRTLFEQAGEAILFIDASSLRIVDANAKAWAIHGYSREELLRLNLKDLADSAGSPSPESLVNLLRDTGSYEGDHFVHVRKDRSKFPCVLNVRQVFVGGQLYLIAVVRDLTEQRKAEEFFRVLFEKASDAVFLVVGEGLRIVEVNEAACRLLGYPREEFLRLSVPDLVPPHFRDRIEGVRQRLQQHSGYLRDRRMLIRKDGSMVATDHAISRVDISGRTYYIASVRDLTEQERAARELEEAKAFLEHVQENASDGFALIDENGVYVAVNQKLMEMRGETRRENIVGTAWIQRTSPESRKEFLHHWDRLMQGERVSMRTTVDRPGGPPIIVDVNSSMILRGERKFVFAIVRDVTAQVKAEEELRRSRENLERHVAERTTQLRESEERFRGAFAQGGIGMALVAPDGRFLQVNRSFCDMLGYSEKELLATTFHAITYSEDRDRSAELIRRMLLENTPSDRFEKRYLHRQGQVVWVDLSTTLIRDSQGTPLYFVTTMQDVTERRRAEEELRESEGRYRALAEYSGVGVWQITPDGHTVYANPAMCAILGVEDSSSLQAGTFHSYFTPESIECIRSEHRKRLQGRASNYEVEIVRPDGTRRQVAVFGAPMSSSDGKLRSMIGTFIDITERKRAEQELRASERRFRAITEGVPVAVLIARAYDGSILYANETAAISLGLVPGTVEGRKVVEFLSRPEDRQEIQLRLEREEFVRDYEVQFRKVDGTLFWGVASLRLATFKGEPATLGVFSDITARKQAQELLEQAHEVLERRVIERTAELARANSLLQDEIAERKRAENALRLILEGTAAVTGGSFFRSLVRHLASALDVRFASVVQGVSQPRGQARTIAFWDGSDFTGPAEYRLEGTPCQDVMAGEACSYSHDVQRLFPDDRRLADFQVESYLGVPMMDSSGAVVGILSVMDPRPISDEELKLSVLKIFAARAGVELERQLADDALRESEERWKALVANAPDNIATVDREGRIQSINRVMPGLKLEEMVGRKATDFASPESIELVRESIETVFRDGKPVAFEAPYAGAGGARKWYAARVGPVVLDGRVVAATIISSDITERRRAEQRQKVQQEVTQVLAESASLEEAAPRMLKHICEGLDWQIGLFWRFHADVEGLRLAEAWHTSQDGWHEVVGRLGDLTVRLHQGGVGRVWKDRSVVWTPDLEKAEGSGRPDHPGFSGIHASFMLPVEGSTGVLGVLEFLSQKGRERDEALVGMVSTLGSQLGQFIERKKAEEDLRFQKSLLESQSEVAIDGILVVSRSGMMTSFNRRFCQMWEIPEDILRTRKDEAALKAVLDKVVNPDAFLGRVRYLYEHPDQESRDEIHLKDGRAFDRYSAPVKGADGVLYGRVWYFRDVTGRKQTEENLRRAAEETRQMYENLKETQAQLIRSEKLASIGMLVSGVAHEINNPLNVMYGNLQLLEEVSDVLLPLSLEGARAKGVRGAMSRVAKFRGMIRDALKAARHAREIVHDFRNFARDTRTAELVDLNECLQEAVTLIQRELKPGIRVVRKFGRIPKMRCLRGQMSQVFLNLLKNAAESIDRRGAVTLRTQQKRGFVVIEIADTGRGMTEEVRQKLFEPFFTTKPVGKGLGLGLSISAMIAQNHNGRITVRSQPGRGSIFRVELPLTS